MYQQITLIGNIGKDPEMRYTPSGHAFTNLQLAVSRRWTREDGQMQEKTNWFNVTLWRRQAEVASQYLSKGNRVLIVGEIDGARSYTDREGNPRAAIDITGHSFRILEGRTNGHDSEQAPSEVETPTEAAEEPLPF
jgi:single-strand DNA-binding protein